MKELVGFNKCLIKSLMNICNIKKVKKEKKLIQEMEVLLLKI